MIEVACWAYFRRGIFDEHRGQPTPLTTGPLDRIGQLYKVEARVCGSRPYDPDTFDELITKRRVAAITIRRAAGKAAYANVAANAIAAAENVATALMSSQSRTQVEV